LSCLETKTNQWVSKMIYYMIQEGRVDNIHFQYCGHSCGRRCDKTSVDLWTLWKFLPSFMGERQIVMCKFFLLWWGVIYYSHLHIYLFPREVWKFCFPIHVFPFFVRWNEQIILIISLSEQTKCVGVLICICISSFWLNYPVYYTLIRYN
jgi:hypothetical protein